MKIELSKLPFQPITITLETNREACILCGLLTRYLNFEQQKDCHFEILAKELKEKIEPLCK